VVVAYAIDECLGKRDETNSFVFKALFVLGCDQ